MIKMETFYSIPEGVTRSLKVHASVDGTALVPFDPLGILSEQLKTQGLTVEKNDDEHNLTDPCWWADHRNRFDWVIGCTMGLSQYSEHILEYGMQISKEGIAVLDRLSFIEPVAKRRTFLLTHKLSNMIVLNPRPRFRAIGSTKDSVTSCWFIFRSPEMWMDHTQVSFALDWDRLDQLPPLPL